MNAYNLANRITSLFEALARYLLSASALAWLVYGAALAALGAGAGGDRAGLLTPVLVIGMLLPLPLFWWLSHRSGHQLARLWERSDRNSTPVLLAMAETIDARAVLLGRSRAAHLRRLVLRALVELAPAAHTAESARRTYDLALDTPGVDHELLRRAAEALGRAQGGRASGSLRLWNLCAARGGSLDSRLVGETITRALEQPLPRRARPLLPVLASALRGGWGETERLLLALLKAGRLAPRHLQPDLRRILADSAECPPALRRKLDPAREKRLARESRAAETTRVSPPPAAPPVAPAARVVVPPAPEPVRPDPVAQPEEVTAEAVQRAPAQPARAAQPAAAPRPAPARSVRKPRAAIDRAAWVKRGAGMLVILVAVLAARFLPGLNPGVLLEGVGEDQAPTYLPQPTGDGRAYTVQVMATKDSLVALGEGRRLRRNGYWSYVLGPRENSVWYRVRMGWFASRAEADSVAAALLANGAIRDRYTTNYEDEAMIWNPDSVGVVRR
jgi:hypothetical protein